MRTPQCFPIPHLRTNGALCSQLYFLAPPALALLGAPGFLAMYLSAAVLGGAAQLMATRSAMSNYPQESGMLARRPALGASGAVNSAIACSILASPRTTYYLFFAIPMPAWLLGCLLLARDLQGSQDHRSSTGHATHLMGAAVGALWFAAHRSGISI